MLPTPPANEPEVTQILDDLTGTDHADLGALIPSVYGELRRLSEAYLRGERADHTLQATALVHEAFVHLASSDGTGWNDRAHFFRAAALTMRRILINHARHHGARKRGGDRKRVGLTHVQSIDDDVPIDILALDEALTRLAETSPQKARVVELRYFAGCTIDETAETLDVSAATVERDWRFARAWLRVELQDHGEGAT